MKKLKSNLIEKAHQQIDTLSFDEVNKMLQQGVTVIDVREADEYSKGAIPGAINIPRSILEFVVDNHIKAEDRDKPYILYCRCGGRAALATVTMRQMGYSKAQAMKKGFADWENEGLQVDHNVT